MSSSSRPFAVITGASSGIGAALTKCLLSQNWNVCLIARSLDKMEKITSNFSSDRYINIKCDISNSEQCISACNQINNWCHGTLHLLVNNAAYNKAGRETESDNSTLEHWDYTMAVNLKAPYIFTKYLVNSLENGAKNPFNGKYDGSIVNISSISSLSTQPGMTPYNISKAGLNSLTRCTAKEFAKYKLRVNALILAIFDTPMLDAVGLQNVEMMKNVFLPAIHPLGRLGNMNDTNQMILFLCDKEKSGFVTGSLINLDGGFMLGPPAPQTQSEQSKL